jgi:hypothetical protein
VITVAVNPKGIDDEYLKCLNLCFSGWGDRQKFQWYFRRKTAYPDPDLMILKQDDQMAAGSAVTYRRVAFANDSEVTVGIMTGSWTLPQFRNQGCFARIIGESLRLTALKGGALLLGFTVDDRSSFRQLARAGSALFPYSYLFSTAQTEAPETRSRFSVVKKSSRVIADLSARLYASGKGCSRFIYASEQEFGSQFIHRPGETEIFEDVYGNCAVVEKTEDTDILQLYLNGSDDEHQISESIGYFLLSALSRGRKLFLCSIQPDVAQLCRKVGLEAKASHLGVLIAEGSRLRDALRIPEPAPMVHASLLAQADSEWFLGNWKLQGGDRA